MNKLSILAVSTAITIVTAKDYYANDNRAYGPQYENSDRGGQTEKVNDRGKPVKKAFERGFLSRRYGEFGSHKFGGWSSYAKGHEQGTYYEKEFDLDQPGRNKKQDENQYRGSEPKYTEHEYAYSEAPPQYARDHYAQRETQGNGCKKSDGNSNRDSGAPGYGKFEFTSNDQPQNDRQLKQDRYYYYRENSR
ncbi:unnamed protein product [Nippostrongylus brasiliensis]|uniref:Secreted protein n=1 Tax=Nippostrongylus brasiliensis TaxID=27835 RepID=A0A0N4YF92_NIPBR|nr:unnamed protein product [Nippostrongylus brasiliensis]